MIHRVTHDIGHWVQHSEAAVRLAGVLIVFAVAMVVSRILRGALSRAVWRRLVRMTGGRDGDDVRRAQRQRTALTLLQSIVRYGIYGAAVVIAVGIATGGGASAIFGASLLVVIVGFGVQKLLTDMLAGMLLLFEGHFAVGDHLTLHQLNVSGVVEQFSLRTTTLRTFSGDRVTVLNGNITAFTRAVAGLREYALEFVADDEQAARRAVERLAESVGDRADERVVRGPDLAGLRQVEGTQLWHASARVAVLPSFEWLCTQSMTASLSADLGAALVGEVHAVSIDGRVVEAYRSALQLGPA